MSNVSTNLVADHKRLLTLSGPLIIANITTPLLGLVDTAILGRMESVEMLAGAAIASLIITQIYWICGFLKMSITGLSAQALPSSINQSLKVIVQGFWLGLLISIFLLAFNATIMNVGLNLAGIGLDRSQVIADQQVAENATRYFEIRILSSPAALCNLAIIGWLIGQQKTKQVLLLQVIVNIANIIFSLLFVYAFNWGVKGVAGATVMAEYLMLGMGVVLIYRMLHKRIAHQQELSHLQNVDSRAFMSLTARLQKNGISWISPKSLGSLIALNSHIFFRNLALQFTLAFVTFMGARYGATAVAVNAIILQFFALIALGLDGVANAVEALVGEAKGLKNKLLLNKQVKIGLLWSSILALAYAVMFYFADNVIVETLTTHSKVIDEMQNYQWILVLLPLIAHWCFLFDGVFVGLGLGKPMRDTMILSALVGFLLTWWVCIELAVTPINSSLWIAMLMFVFCRGVLLGAYYWYCYQNKPHWLMN